MNHTKIWIAFSASVLIVGLFVLLFQIYKDRELETQNAYDNLESLSRTFQENAFRSIKEIHQILLILKKDAENPQLQSDVTNTLVDIQNIQQRVINLLAITNEKGDLIASSQLPFQPVTLSDRSYFFIHEKSADTRLFLGTPVLGRASGKSFIPMSLRYNRPDGSFAGVILSSTNPIYYSDYYSSLGLDEGISVFLLLESGDILSSFGVQSNSLTDLTENDIFRRLLAGEEPGKAFYSFLDGKSKLLSFRKVPDYQVYILISQERGAIFKESDHRAFTQILFYAGFCCIVIFWNILLFFSQKKNFRYGIEIIKNEERLKLALDCVEDGVWDWHIPSGKSFFSHNYYKMLGYEGNEFPPSLQSWEKLIHPEDYPSVLKAIQTHIELKQNYIIEFRMKTKEGAWKWILSRGKIIETDPDGNPIRMIGTHTDIDSQKRNEESLSQSREVAEESKEEAMRLLKEIETQKLKMEGLYQGSKVILESFSFPLSSNKLLTICKEITGSKDAYISLFSEEKEYQQIISAARASREISLQRKLGLNVPVRMSDQEKQVRQRKEIMCNNFPSEIPWFREPDEPPAYLENILFAPLVVRNEMQGILGLANKIGGYTAEDIHFIEAFSELLSLALYNSLNLEELLKARNKALEDDRLKSEFLEVVNREIRTPVNSILGILDILLSSPLNAQQKEYMELVKVSSKQLLKIIADFLQVTYLNGNKAPIVMEAFELNDFLKNLYDFFSLSLQNKNITFSFISEPHLPKVLRGDWIRLRQILINVIGNALKFTIQGTVTLSISDVNQKAIEAGSQDFARDTWLQFLVKDTGIGMTQEMQKKVYDDSIVSRTMINQRKDEIGLGLAITSKLVESMKGKIEFESEAGKGTTFTIRLPFQVEENPVLPRVAASAKTAAVSEEFVANFEGLRVLLAEDDNINRKIVKTLLERRGCIIYEAQDGMQAIEIWKKNTVDVILMDIRMPRLDGYEATRLIRSEEAGKNIHTPIIALTAYAMQEDRLKCLETGMDEHVAKPIQKEELLKKIAGLGKRAKPEIP